MTSRRIDLPAVYSWLKSQPGGATYGDIARRFGLPPKGQESILIRLEDAGLLLTENKEEYRNKRNQVMHRVIFRAFERN